MIAFQITVDDERPIVAGLPSCKQLETTLTGLRLDDVEAERDPVFYLSCTGFDYEGKRFVWLAEQPVALNSK